MRRTKPKVYEMDEENSPPGYTSAQILKPKKSRGDYKKRKERILVINVAKMGSREVEEMQRGPELG